MIKVDFHALHKTDRPLVAPIAGLTMADPVVNRVMQVMKMQQQSETARLIEQHRQLWKATWKHRQLWNAHLVEAHRWLAGFKP